VKRPIRVLTANTQAAICAGVRRSLEGHGFEIVAEAASAEVAVELALRERPDVCLLDIDLPGDAVRVIETITTAVPGTAVVVLTASTRDSDLLDALRAGAVGYLPMSTDSARLPHALHGVMAGEAAVPRQLVSRLIDELRSQGERRRIAAPGRPATEVTRREWEVLALVREGLTTADIAGRLLVSPVTVRRHASAAVKKLGLSDRAAAARLIGTRAA
jgi:DNA-binding NarL/FixJ family response regulator